MILSNKRTFNQSGSNKKSIYNAIPPSNQSRVSKKSESESKKSFRVPVRLIDINGTDYTPLPLLGDDKKLKEIEKDTPTDNISQVSFYTQSISSLLGTNPLGFARSKSQQSSSGFTAESSSSMSDEVMEGGAPSLSLYAETKTSNKDKNREFEDDELDNNADIVLEETDTIWIFDMNPTMFMKDCDESAEIEARNQNYESLLSSRAGNDKFVEKGMGTFANAMASKTIQTNRIVLNDVDTMVTIWDMYDKNLEKVDEDRDAPKEDNFEINTSPNAAVGEKPTSLETINSEPSSSKPGLASRSPTSADKTRETASTTVDADLFGSSQSSVITSTIRSSQAKNEEILNSEKMDYSLFVMERALNMNCYFEKMLYYRDLPYFEELMMEMKLNEANPSPGEDLDSSSISKPKPSEDLPVVTLKSDLSASHPHLEKLWEFQVSFTKGKNIAAMAWNRHNSDILAVCYGNFDYKKQTPGLVCCWSLKNIDYPERTFHLPSGVTALSWSKTHSNLLAIGMFNGTISVFDVRTKSNEPVIDTKNSTGRHLGPVRQLDWIIRVSGRSEEHSEVLISTSSDGRVTQWSIRKGFESSDLMKLKRIATKIPGAGKQKKTDALISQYASGSSFAFNPKDPNIYLVGVEEGHIHKCSCSYNEQYLENFYGHTAPVYSIKWSPFLNEIFLSCSADWTIKLWHIERQSPVINFQSAVKSVNSIAWSPKSSVIFACVNEGSVEVWNLQLSTLDPLIVETITTNSTVLTSVIFTESGECLLVGDSDGVLHTFVIRNVNLDYNDQTEALEKTIQSCIASQM